MSKTAFTTNSAETKKLYDEKLFRDVVKESYFSRFMGKNGDTNAIVNVKDALEKSKGDQITFAIRMRLTGAGVTGDNTLEGNEEKLNTYTETVNLEQYRHAVRDAGGLTRQMSMFDIDAESEQAIKDWGTEKIDKIAFDAIFDSASKFFYKTSGGVTSTSTYATAKGAIDATNSKLTPDMISAIATWARNGGARANNQIPFRPVKVEGGEYLVLLCPPDVCYDLKVNSDYRSAIKEALERSPKHPLFTGALGMWDGVVIHEHENCPTGTDGGSGSVAYGRAKLLGAQSLVWAWGKRAEVVKETFDFGNQHAYAWGVICGAKKPQFGVSGSEVDYGSAEVVLARTNITGL